MSHLHFVIHDEYRKRVIQLGEKPEHVFNVGALGVENIKKMSLIKKNKLEKDLGFKFNEKNLLVTFHPVTLDEHQSLIQVKEVFKALSELKNTEIIVTLPNADPEGLSLIKYINDFARQHKNFHAFVSLGQIKYLSCMKYVDGVVGNSSSGILEAPSFNIGTINIGDRQKGRIQAESIINCSPDRDEIYNAVKTLYSQKFKKSLKYTHNPYGDGKTSKKIIDVIKKFKSKNLLMKSFHDLDFKRK